MKKIIVFLVAISLVLSACSSQNQGDNKEESEEQSNEPVFTKEDIQLAKEIIKFVNKKEANFVKKANKKLRNGDNSSSFGGRDKNKVAERFRPLSEEMILQPLLERYGDHIIKNGDLTTGVNAGSFTWNGTEKKPSPNIRVFQTYKDLTLKEPKVKHHKNQLLNMHELIIQVNEQKTKIFPENPMLFYYTFYKSKEGKLIVGKLPPLSWNAYIIDFETEYKEDLKEKLKQLPPLQ